MYDPGVPSPRPVPTPESHQRHRRRALSNLLKMGHCAPSVMRTLLDLEGADGEWLVKLVAGLPGGIGNTRGECGGLTAPVALMGLDCASEPSHDGLPAVVRRGQRLCARFADEHGTVTCAGILGDRRVPLPCISVVRHSPELYQAAVSDDEEENGVETEKLRGLRAAHGYFVESGFHCAHSVLWQLRPSVAVTRELLDATSGFVGGTLFEGMTCSALTAGVMAVGLQVGKIENSHIRVMRLIARMVLGGNAFDDSLNEFNRIMNIGQRMAVWFRSEFGSTQCRAITGADFASTASVASFVERDAVARCRGIAAAVAEKVRGVLTEQAA